MPMTSQQKQWLQENARFDNGQWYQKVNGQWVASPTNTIALPGSHRPQGGGGAGPGGGGGVRVGIPILGGGAERPTIPGGGATGPGGATFRPGTPTPPIAGSGLPPVSFAPPTTPAPDTPTPDTPTPATPASATTTVPPLNTGGTGGGTVDAILDALKKYGPLIAAGTTLAGKVATGRQAGRAAEQVAANKNNVTNLARYTGSLGSLNTDLAQRVYLGNEYDRNTDNAVRGGYMQGVEDINIPRPAGVSSRNITGGLRPSAFTNRKEVGAAMEKEAMTELLDPTRVASDPRPGTKRLPALPTLPEKIDVAEPGTLDAILSGLGYAGAVGPLIDALIKSTTPAPATPTVNDLPITPPDPLVVKMPDINLGNAPLDPNADTGTQGLIDTLYGPTVPGRRRNTGYGSLYPR